MFKWFKKGKKNKNEFEILMEEEQNKVDTLALELHNKIMSLDEKADNYNKECLLIREEMKSLVERIEELEANKLYDIL